VEFMIGKRKVVGRKEGKWNGERPESKKDESQVVIPSVPRLPQRCQKKVFQLGGWARKNGF